MKVLYFRPDTVDCTSDPHYVNYTDVDEMLKDVLKVLESGLVKSIASVRVYDENQETILEADDYSTFEGSKEKGRKLAEGKYAEQHKVAGLYFYSDAKDTIKIPPGITGYKAILAMIPDRLPVEKIRSIVIGVVWTFANDHSCSDYITIEVPGMMVNYENQDWWRGIEGYEQHCADLSKLIGQTIEPYEG
ncbi:hypothetical protein LCGC14_2576110 [marine sediment metagenome]|uniref:Uncharacterized protein n=1 Tax=marine sediment metagenome TaxID=412755 RepID=A0A0F9CS02_9ZZZZ